MNAEQLIRCLQNPVSLSAISADEFTELVNSFPWFGTAQILAAIKQQQENKPDAAAQIQKALLYTDQPLRLQLLYNRFTEIKNEKISATPELQDPVVPETNSDSSATIYLNELDAAVDAEVFIEAVNEQEAQVLMKQTETETNAEIIILAADETEAAALLKEVEVTADANEIVGAADAAEQEINFKPLSDILKQDVTADDKFSFEPLHAVDYFASQGIRLKEERMANDKLGQQLKTFTQWLKTMKKVDASEESQMDEIAEKNLVQMAGGSNRPEEIITESMAKVLEQQGKTQKAAELYRKLSLLHPEKSVYFAAQIERLNN